MKRLPLLLLLVIAVGFLSCSEDEGPTGPVMTAPDSLTAVALSESQVYLEWIDTTPFELGYRVQRALSGSVSWNLVTDSLEMNANNYTDSGLEEGTVYNYRVKAFNARGETEPSNVVEITTLAAAPSGLVAEQDSSNFTSVNLTWIDESGKETGFQIQRKQGRNGEYEIIGETDADSTSFLDEGLEPNALYFYQVRAMIDVLGSHWSNEDWARTNVLTPLPPSNLEAEATSPNTIRLRWNDNAIDNDGFILERSLDEESGWAAIATLEDVEAHVDGNLYDETTYYYRLAAYNSYGNSDYSNVASATTPAGPPLAPS
ncbi:MAG TPA: fibronectin type III domain-containing protein, partial [Bacteroidetes bacterium]|nr:fibronectin type III domain-containing protein [Bacteroidota bacterium]